jgi:diaminohydroxyphosphoribosylaminopyrimidine deaminase/5-amino-6-(5-phosphoribosylamino)uracil reductase
VERILEAGVVRVIASTEDPNPLVRGRGFAQLKARGISVDVGLGRERAIALNQPYFTLLRERRPFVILKAATSLDGRIAAGEGVRTRLTSAAADRHAHRLRAQVDAIGVGAGTVLVDDPLLTVRGVYRERPLARVIFDRRLRTPGTARVLSTRDVGPVIIVTTPRGAEDNAVARHRLEQCGAVIEVAADETFGAALTALGSRQIGSLLLEGGATIHRAAWQEDLVDFVRLYVAPHVLGSSAVPLFDERFSSAPLVDRRVEPVGPDVVIEGYVHRPC